MIKEITDLIKASSNLLETDISKKLFSPSAEYAGDIILDAVIVVSIPFIPILSVSKLSPYLKKYCENLFHKLGEKLVNKKIKAPDFELTCLIHKRIMYKELENNTVAELLLNILAENMDQNNNNGISDSDYIKYVKLIDSLFPNSLILLYKIHNRAMKHENILLMQNIEHIYEYEDKKYIKGKIIESNSVLNSQQAILDKISSTKKQFLYNSGNIFPHSQYIYDLENAGLIEICEIRNLDKYSRKSTICFEINGVNYVCKGIQTKITNEIVPKGLGKLIINNFYNKDVLNIINSNDIFSMY
ncbi:hypothetical protein HPDP_00319 [Candidatus Hepatincola sp. Pdp]